MNRCYQLSRQRDRRASAQRRHFGVPRTQYVKPVPATARCEQAYLNAFSSEGSGFCRREAAQDVLI
jgi:hypothetical protein